MNLCWKTLRMYSLWYSEKLLHQHRNRLHEISRHSEIEITILVTTRVGESEALQPYQEFSDIDQTLMKRAVALVNEQRDRFVANLAM